MDKIQLLAVASVADALDRANIDADSLEKEQVAVIAASSLGLQAARDLEERVRYAEFKDALSFLDAGSLDRMLLYKDRFPIVTEDTGHGVLNNVVAGRVCNAFDLKGKNFNVDANWVSSPAALGIAVREIKAHGGMIIVVSCDEKLNETKTSIAWKGVSCMILAPLSLAKENKYPIESLIDDISYAERI